MLFSSIYFLFYFLPVTLLIYYLIPKKHMNVRNLVLLLASLFFYSWGEPIYVLLMIYSMFFNYFMGLQINSEQRKGGSGKRNLIFAVIVNLFILGFFKYYGFIVDSINGLFHTNIHYTALALPIGISFYTFQAMSYIIDVYRKNVAPQSSLLKFSLYLSLFPQLIAGPIVKYRDVAEQIDNRTFSLEGFGRGAVRFAFGLGKKVLLANNLGALHSLVLGLDGSQASVVTSWIGAIAYMLQIYFDFSGYSDMAIGLGKMLGFDFMENFRFPYIARSITEFWRRWHISLSSWFREYVYIPLGGNRVKPVRHIINLLIVWALTGLWHGASWNFVVWGLFYFVILALEKYTYGNKLSKAPGAVKHIYTLLVVLIAWVFFFSNDLGSAVNYLRDMFGFGGHAFINMETLYLLRTNIIMLAISGVFSTPIVIEKAHLLAKKHSVIGLIAVFAIIILSVAYLIYSTYNPFLYFRF